MKKIEIKIYCHNITIMTMSSRTNTYDEYLKSFVRADKDEHYTHTRIGSKELNVYGGSYIINEENLDRFYEVYSDQVFTKKKQEYLTEKQLIEDGPILVDMDLHYDTSIDNRQHTENHIIDMIELYSDKIAKLLNINKKCRIPVFIFEKPNVNMLEIKTKDGIHMLIGVKMHKALQVMLRDMVKDELASMWDDLPITNNWDLVLDEGITRGHVNWQLYGSRKPGHKAYELTGIYYLCYEDGDCSMEKESVKDFDIKKSFKLLTAQYKNHISFDVNDNVRNQYEKVLEGFTKNNKKTSIKKKIIIKNLGEKKGFDINDISSQEILDKQIEDMFTDIRPIEYDLKETHQFVMILPESFYGPGSYDKWMRVGWALKNTSDKLFISWVKFSSQSSEFDYGSIPEMYENWQNFESKTEDCLTKRSIMYWAKNNATKEVYDNVRKATIEYFINVTIQTSTEYDFANVLYNIFKDTFVCASIKGTLWYEYRGHKWHEIDSGTELRKLISKDMHDIYCQRSAETVENLQTLDQSDQRYEDVRKQTNKLSDICILLKKTSWKNNIMREAQELFYDGEFIDKLDQNQYLLCFNNGVVDFKQSLFRRGQPDDYISMCTNIDYIEINKNAKSQRILSEIEEFMNQLFPNVDVRKYMWEHLASCLIGTNENQTFNIYTGSGANGKSKLVDLMTKCLGDYKGTVPLTLITQKRTSIGSTSDEIAQLKGTRMAVMQEPSKGDKINEGIMKEITGGDPIQGRALYKNSITFIPQFKLVVTTNTLFDIRSNDDGTWRRIRLCDFQSKFVEEPFSDELKFPTEHYPYQYKIDKKLDSKFPEWAPLFAAKLVEIGFKTKGIVKDCKEVLAASDRYRNGQDYLSEFAKEKIMRIKGGKIIKSELMEEFKKWYTLSYGRGNIPQAKEVYEFMDKRYGTYKKDWQNIAIIYDESDGQVEEGDINNN